MQKEDFLTLLLTDELFMNDEAMVTDECITFLGAATQTTTLMITNAMYYFITNRDILEKARSEIKNILKVTDLSNLTE